MARLNWIIERPFPLTKIAISSHGKFRVSRGARVGNHALWSAALDQPGPWSYAILGLAFASDEEARGACHDYAEKLDIEQPTAKVWPFIRLPA